MIDSVCGMGSLTSVEVDGRRMMLEGTRRAGPVLGAGAGAKLCRQAGQSGDSSRFSSLELLARPSFTIWTCKEVPLAVKTMTALPLAGRSSVAVTVHIKIHTAAPSAILGRDTKKKVVGSRLALPGREGGSAY